MEKTVYRPKTVWDKCMWGGRLIYFRKSIDFSDDEVFLPSSGSQEVNEFILFMEKKIDLIAREIDLIMQMNIK